MDVAQTNIQLYNQLRRQKRSEDDLKRVQLAYEFVTSLYGGYLQSDGKPFLAHLIGVASIVSQLGTSIDTVLAALAHNAYGNGDFGDGLSSCSNARRRKMMVAALGEAAEEMVLRFPNIHLSPDTLGGISERLDAMSETERSVLLLGLSDILEKYADFGVLYYGEDRWARELEDEHAEEVCEIARRLDQPALAAALAQAFAAVAAEEELLNGRLRTSDGRRHLKLVVPRSCRRRLLPYLVSRTQKWGRRAGKAARSLLNR